jgi:hypothetical protein
LHSITRRILTIIWAALLGFFIALTGQGVWTVLVSINLATSPAIPWSVLVMAPILLVIWLYLDGRWWPRSTSQARHRDLRANPVSGQVFAWAFLGCYVLPGKLEPSRCPSSYSRDLNILYMGVAK